MLASYLLVPPNRGKELYHLRLALGVVLDV